jgi:ATP-dependent DNA helicase RecG
MMKPIVTTELSAVETDRLLVLDEGHFSELKAVDISPSKLTRTIAAFSNAEGGELFIGIDEDKTTGTRSWRGFSKVEDANGHLQAFEDLFPLGIDYQYDFLNSANRPGLVLKVQVAKSREIKSASDGKVYIRRGAQNLPVETQERIEILKRDKGLTSFENEPVNCDQTFVTNSQTIIGFMLEVIPTSEPEPWLHKQMILIDSKPTVAAVVLFADEPQAILPKRSGVKIYRYKTSAEQGTRESLEFDPISIEGCAYIQITQAVAKTQSIIQSVRVRTADGLQSVRYPVTAIHEIITNAVLHRDYSIADDIHIRIYDNRVEVSSPGTLPGHVTPDNILEERFARNGAIVRLINKFPNPPNKDVGEGLNTAFAAMREMKLRDPQIAQTGGYVTVVLRHEPLASPEETILKYLQSHGEIANRQAREICYIGSENRMKTILQRMVADEFIELVPGRTRYNAAYRLPAGPIREPEAKQGTLDLPQSE